MLKGNLLALGAMSPLIALLIGCGGGDKVVSRETVSGDVPAWESFKAQSTRVTEGGNVLYIIEGDIGVNEDFLRTYYDNKYVDVVEKSSGPELNGVRLKWTDTEKLSLGYCIKATGWPATMRDKVIADMNQAMSQWMSAANVVFTYLPARDANCAAGYTGVNNDIKINVLPGDSVTAFSSAYPAYPAPGRYLYVYQNYTCDPNVSCAFFTGGYSILGAFTHELGHSLGLSHEQYVPPCNSPGEDPALTYNLINTYDPDSAMHYYGIAGCPTKTTGQMTALDKAGLAILYGAPTSSKIAVLPVDWILAASTTLL